MTHRTFACALSILALTAACGGGGNEATPPATPAAPAAPAEPAPVATAAPPASAAPAASAAPTEAAPPSQPGPGDWDKWTHEQKLAWMKSAVMPKMHDLFAAFDATKFGDMKCKGCHGAGAADGSFKMPNADLPKLDATPDGFKKLAKSKAKMFDFMMKQVEPTMAGLVGEPVYDMKTNAGFVCFECHTKK
jgi:hypothetical protein